MFNMSFEIFLKNLYKEYKKTKVFGFKYNIGIYVQYI